MRNKLIIAAALLLCSCETTQTAPEVAVETKVVEKLVPVMAKCEATVGPAPDFSASPRRSVEEKVDVAAQEILALNQYLLLLQVGFVSCGGTIK